VYVCIPLLLVFTSSYIFTIRASLVKSLVFLVLMKTTGI